MCRGLLVSDPGGGHACLQNCETLFHGSASPSWIQVPILSLGSPHFVWASRLLSMIGDLSLLPSTFTDLSKDPPRWHMPALCHSSNTMLTTFSRLQKHALKQLFGSKWPPFLSLAATSLSHRSGLKHLPF